MAAEGAPGRLVVAATPIGNPADASPRLAELLRTADVVAAEDTRRLARLAAALEVRVAGRVVSHFEGNEAGRLAGLLAEVRAGRTVALLTDAGMPLVSDPGHRLVAAAAAEGLPVTVLPGPSAVLAALAVAGLPTDRFVFEGFLPRRAGERRRRVAELAADRRTTVFFEAPHRLAVTLADLVAAFGADRPAAACRELTKTYEEVRRGGLAELAGWAAGGVRGEVTLVVGGAAGADRARAADPVGLASAVAAREAAGEDRRTATAAVAKAAGVPKRAVFDAMVISKRGGSLP